MRLHTVQLLILLTTIGCCDRSHQQLAVAIPPEISESSTTILFGGDTHFGESYFEEYGAEGMENILVTHGYKYSSSVIRDLAIDAEFVIVNLETPVTNIVSSAFEGVKPYIHWSDMDKTPEALKALNVTAVSLANNHMLDFGIPGLSQTQDVLSRYGIATFGAGKNAALAARPYHLEFPHRSQASSIVILAGFEFHRIYDKKYSFYAEGSRGGVNAWTPKEAVRQVRQARAANPDAFLVLFPHWGNNYKWRDRAQYRLAHTLVDAGADLILGHGAHMFQEVERYKGRWIVYGLGNFVFNSIGRYERMDADPYSLVAQLELDDNKEQPNIILRLYPIFSNNRVTNFQPRFLTHEEFQEAGSLLLNHSRQPAQLENYLWTARDHSDRYYFWTYLRP